MFDYVRFDLKVRKGFYDIILHILLMLFKAELLNIL